MHLLKVFELRWVNSSPMHRCDLVPSLPPWQDHLFLISYSEQPSDIRICLLLILCSLSAFDSVFMWELPSQIENRPSLRRELLSPVVNRISTGISYKWYMGHSLVLSSYGKWYICIYIYLYTHNIYTYICMCMNICVYICMYMCIYTYTHIYKGKSLHCFMWFLASNLSHICIKQGTASEVRFLLTKRDWEVRQSYPLFLDYISKGWFPSPWGKYSWFVKQPRSF